MKKLRDVSHSRFAPEVARLAATLGSAFLLASPPVWGNETRTSFAARVVVPPKAEVIWGEVAGPAQGSDCAALEALLHVQIEEGSPLLLWCEAGGSGTKSPGPRRHRLVVTLARLDKPPAGATQVAAGPTLTVDF